MRRFARVIALWFGCGKVPIAPGTAGTLGALPLCLLVVPHGVGALLLTIAVLLPIAIWSSGVVARETASHDPQIVVVDEVVGMLIACLWLPSTTLGYAIAFLLFRAFDQVKPFPARRAERLAGGYGIVMDDVFAGLWAAGFGLGIHRSWGIT
jgi:phosphatidylglycerophosphatase A